MEFCAYETLYERLFKELEKPNKIKAYHNVVCLFSFVETE